MAQGAEPSATTSPVPLAGDPLAILRADKELIEKVLRKRPYSLVAPFVMMSYALTLGLVGGLYASTRTIPEFASIFLAIFLVSIPVLIAFYFYDKREQRRRKYEDLTKQYFEATGGGELPYDFLNYLKTDIEKGTPLEKIQARLARRGYKVELETLEALAYMLEAIRILLPSVNEAGRETLAISKLYWNRIENRSIIYVQYQHTNTVFLSSFIKDWMVVTSLKKSYANVYVDVTGNGRNVYLSNDAAVKMSVLEGTSYCMFAATGGDADVYQLFDAHGVEQLQAIKPQFDFEIFNDRLILRRSLTPKTLFRNTRAEDELFHPDAIDNIYSQMTGLSGILNKNASSRPDPALQTIADTWHTRISEKRGRFLLTLARYEFVAAMGFCAMAFIGSLIPFVVAVLIFS